MREGRCVCVWWGCISSGGGGGGISSPEGIFFLLGVLFFLPSLCAHPKLFYYKRGVSFFLSPSLDQSPISPPKMSSSQEVKETGGEGEGSRGISSSQEMMEGGPKYQYQVMWRILEYREERGR